MTTQQAANHEYLTWLAHQGRLNEYLVDEVRTSLIGGKVDGAQIGGMINARARVGWSVKSVTKVDVKGRVGPGGTEGLLIVYERPVSAPQ